MTSTARNIAALSDDQLAEAIERKRRPMSAERDVLSGRFLSRAEVRRQRLVREEAEARRHETEREANDDARRDNFIDADMGSGFYIGEFR